MSGELHEKRPRGREWIESFFPRGTSLQGSAWLYGTVQVLSTLDQAELPGGGGRTGPQWHISISRNGKRPKPTDVRRALRAFGMTSAEEDNHHPGIARHFFLPVDPAYRTLCECKETEVTVTDPDGYRWTNPADPEACRGCELALQTGRPCPLHSALQGVL